jgi:16S rRNA (adenine1518-N6/adenine1519-N6)-dimethyltransferase
VSASHPRALLARWGLRPKKRYGQNFLMDGGAARKIARLSLQSGNRRVLEIGAGTGELTRALIEEGADVTALEIDRDLITLLRARDDLGNATIVDADALEFDFAAWAGADAWSVAGNLPYNVATPLIVQLVEMEHGPATLTVMVQRDVAERLAAAPGSAAYGSLSVAVQYAMHVKRAFTLGPSAFYPAPKVHSSVVQLERRETPAVAPRDLELFRKVVRAAFAYRRKTLANSIALALGIERERIARACTESGIQAEQRGEQLTLDDFCKLADTLAGS